MKVKKHRYFIIKSHNLLQFTIKNGFLFLSTLLKAEEQLGLLIGVGYKFLVWEVHLPFYEKKKLDFDWIWR